MNIQRIFEKYYQPGTPLYNSVWPHSKLVAEKALKLAQAHPELNIDSDFVYEAAMLHDIGVYLTHAPSIYCTGEEPYIRHGIIGAELLRNEGYPKHALVCERHTGTGLTVDDIISQNLPLPHRDMCPISLEEKLVCFPTKKNRSIKFVKALLNTAMRLYTVSTKWPLCFYRNLHNQ